MDEPRPRLTTVLPQHRVVVEAPELPVGSQVEVVLRRVRPPAERAAAVREWLAAIHTIPVRTPGRTAAEAEAELSRERDAWDDPRP